MAFAERTRDYLCKRGGTGVSELDLSRPARSDDLIVVRKRLESHGFKFP